ncbi:MAG: glycosyl transferase [Chloroflexi bacterium]|nr:glycosyl transferase [Chloroflexota bacterium]
MKTEIAFIIDALQSVGGAEKVLMAALELFPGAPVYTLVYNRDRFIGTPILSHPVVPSYINRLPFVQHNYRNYLPLMPAAIERFDLSRYDILFSYSYAVAHGILTTPGQRHISYTFTPMRYAWRDRENGVVSPSLHRWIEGLLNSFRKWDIATVQRIDQLAAVSRWIAGWIEHDYQREARVIYPPVDIERFQPQRNRDDYYITVSRLVSHKRIDLIVEAFAQLKLPLIVVGEGPEYRRLVHIATDNIRVIGYQSEASVANLLNKARAFVIASEEDFGIAVVEAQAAGCPVIAYGRGGVLETVIDGQTGIFYSEQTVESLIAAVRCFEHRIKEFHQLEIQANAHRFTKTHFQQELISFITQL